MATTSRILHPILTVYTKNENEVFLFTSSEKNEGKENELHRNVVTLRKPIFRWSYYVQHCLLYCLRDDLISVHFDFNNFILSKLLTRYFIRKTEYF